MTDCPRPSLLTAIALATVAPLAPARAAVVDGAVAEQAVDDADVQVVDRVVAFSEDGREALVARATSDGGGVRRSYLVVGLDPERPIELEATYSYVVSTTVLTRGRPRSARHVAFDAVDADQCRTAARALRDRIARAFYGVASVDVGACQRARDIVDLKGSLSLHGFSPAELSALQARHGAGAYVAVDHGPLVLVLRGDARGGTRLAATFARDDHRLSPRF